MTASPRWPADATLLREVFRAARSSGWSRHEMGRPRSSSYLDQHVWEETDGLGMVYVDRPDPAVYDPQGSVQMTIHGACGGPEVWVGSVGSAVDLLVALDILPAELSSAYRRGRVDGMEVIHALAVDKVAGERVEAPWSQLLDPDVLAGIGRDLDGLLDRDGFARRRQVDRIVETVLKAAGMGA